MPIAGLFRSAGSAAASLLLRLRCRKASAISLAAMLAVVAAPGAASADGCAGVTACQIEQQEALLAPFNTLPVSPAGQAALGANLATINAIYLNSTQAQKIASGTMLIPQDIPANLLLRAAWRKAAACWRRTSAVRRCLG